MTAFSSLTGRLLVAMPGIDDDRFRHAVILICAHDDEHALGLRLDQPAPGVSLAEVLEKLDTPVDDVVMLADGNGDFTRAVGLALDAKGFGMGERSQRYSMLVKDGVVDQLNIEQGGEFKVSSAEHLLAQL